VCACVCFSVGDVCGVRGAVCRAVCGVRAAVCVQRCLRSAQWSRLGGTSFGRDLCDVCCCV
jgi:hypothetical protein